MPSGVEKFRLMVPPLELEREQLVPLLVIVQLGGTNKRELHSLVYLAQVFGVTGQRYVFGSSTNELYAPSSGTLRLEVEENFLATGLVEKNNVDKFVVASPCKLPILDLRSFVVRRQRVFEILLKLARSGDVVDFAKFIYLWGYHLNKDHSRQILRRSVGKTLGFDKETIAKFEGLMDELISRELDSSEQSPTIVVPKHSAK